MKKLVLLLLLPLWSFCQTSYQDLELLLVQKNYTKAEQLASPMVANNPTDLKAIELLGDAYGYQEKWDEAMIQYQRLVDLKPKEANYHYKFGGALGMKALSVNKLSAVIYLGDLKEAFLTAASLDENHIEARWALVELYMQLPAIVGGSKNTSLKYANQLEQLSEVDGYLAKGYIYEYDDEPELAETYYKKAIEIGGSKVCYQHLIDLYKLQKKYTKAIEVLDEAYEKLLLDDFRKQRKALEAKL